MPLADGGEGSCELLTLHSGGSFEEVEVHDPLLRKIRSRIGVSADRKTAFVEMAAASGLQLLSASERNPLNTSTFGTGELILHAIDIGVSRIVLGIGGSATNDGGMGMAEALGLHSLSSSGKRLSPTGGNLKSIYQLDSTTVHHRLKEISFTLFCDVDNPLHGERGAAYVFAPQKGASPTDVVLLDEGLRHLEKILHAHSGGQFNFPGAGAGGGLSVALKALANVTITSGMKFISEFTGLEELVREAEIVITGEGHLDDQTLSGKVVKGVADLALKHGKPVLVIAGKNSWTQEKASAAGITKVLTLQSAGMPVTEAMSKAAATLRNLVRNDVVAWLKEC